MVQLGLVVNDTKDGNLEFSKQVNLPVNLKIFELNAKNYEEFSNLKLDRVQIISFKYAYNSKPKINMKVFSDKCYTLKSLKIHRPILATCNLEEECGFSIQQKSIFPNLGKLFINHVDNYGIHCDGQEIQWMSKNICFLLDSIQSEQVRVLVLKVNSDFSGINSCIGRRLYRFEDRVLPEFISRQPQLDNLILDIPIYSPNERHHGGHEPSSSSSSTPKLKIYSSKLKSLDVRSQCGMYEVMDDHQDHPQFIYHTELLTYDPHFYNELIVSNSTNHFWRSFLLAQTQLISAYFINLANFGTASLIAQIIKNNQSTLICLSIDAHFSGIIDIVLLKDSIIKKLHICNVVFQDVIPDGEGDSFLKNVIHLPTTIKTLTLLNVRVDIEELKGLIRISTLRSFSFMYTGNHYKQLDDEDFFQEFLRIVLHHRGLKNTSFGQIGPAVVAAAELQLWYDELAMKVRVPYYPYL